ncbi:serine hydrolase [Catenuloplanes atrovinosus]|uniref:Beta-lactamase class A n=1 Tax=Catenuloplanes atrovinosus TaxID=137266 RepID=A0AAE4C9A2_9ACTN|nr:serine hydrolase [Catenuloplanes atrovinosus]MDR7274604.1 beta-lactamase class A [Catenuloplanes atrovinosus]
MRSSDGPAHEVRRLYRDRAAEAGGRWHALITHRGTPVVDDDADAVLRGYSVQKLAVAVAVLDAVDRGRFGLDHLVDVPAGIVLPGSGIYALQTVWGDRVTVANVLTAMLLVSDNTAVRLCGRLVPAREINEILAAKGFARTRVEPVEDPHRFFLGVTTPRETHDLLTRLAGGTLLSPAGSAFMLGVLRGLSGYHDGVRREMSSEQRSRVASKYGADWEDGFASRHEAGVVFDRSGRPALVFSLFADRLGDVLNYGGTHPAVRAHAALGPALMRLAD